MSRQAAEPDPNRNHDPADANPVDFGLPQEFASAMQQIATDALSFATGVYGRQGRRGRAEVSRVVVHRPDTGHVMFFRREAPIDAGGSEQSALLVVDEVQAGGPAGVMTDAQARTFAGILGVDAEALLALLNVPEVSIHEWTRAREMRRGR